MVAPEVMTPAATTPPTSSTEPKHRECLAQLIDPSHRDIHTLFMSPTLFMRMGAHLMRRHQRAGGRRKPSGDPTPTTSRRSCHTWMYPLPVGSSSDHALCSQSAFTVLLLVQFCSSQKRLASGHQPPCLPGEAQLAHNLKYSEPSGLWKNPTAVASAPGTAAGGPR
jgi:hypothetical protein